MNCIVWNARGMGNPRTFHELRRLCADHSPCLVFICETKITSSKCGNWRSMLGFAGQFVVDASGRKGGLILWWKEDMSVSISSYSEGHIDCCVQSDKGH